MSDADEIEIGVTVKVTETDALGIRSGRDYVVYPRRAIFSVLKPAAVIVTAHSQCNVEIGIAVDIAETKFACLRRKNKNLVKKPLGLLKATKEPLSFESACSARDLTYPEADRCRVFSP